MKQIRIAVGTKNPCKIEAVRKAFATTFASDKYEIVTLPFSCPSGVPDQPFGDDETRQGAINRANGALEAAKGCNEKVDFSVGLEGGIEIIKNKVTGVEDLWCMAFMCVIGTASDICTGCKHPESTFQASEESSKQELIGIAKTAVFPLPKEISRLVLEEKMELGHADDKLFKRVNSKQGDGTVGMLTKSHISRTEYYHHAIILALIPFTWPEHYL